jgi:hypothetical protein
MHQHIDEFDLQPRGFAGWIRLSAAASKAGISSDLLAKGCMSGDIPVALRRVGPRLRFVSLPQLHAWLHMSHSPYTADDLARSRMAWPPVQPAAHEPEEINLFEET